MSLTEQSATPNHALQRTAPARHTGCSHHLRPQPPYRSRCAAPPQSLSLGSLAITMRLNRPTQVFLAIVAGLLLAFGGLAGVRWAFGRERQFREQAERGQPIVRAIEDFRKETGSYPASLADLAPKHLATVPEIPDRSQHKYTGWDYRTVTNGAAVSYSLRYYMGRGGIEYEPPHWIGNNEGSRKIILTNE